MADSFHLTDEEVEQAMILNKCSQEILTDLLAFICQAQHLSALVLLMERLGHADNALQTLQEVGREEGMALLEEVKGIICREWGYCRRRATDGLGDPRVLVRILAPLIGPRLEKFKRNGEALDRSLLVVICVFVARSGLSNICQCSGK